MALTFPGHRTGFDLLFQALRFPKGSEVICSAVTIKDMVKIVQHHGMTPIAVDLDMHTLEPDMNLLRKAFTPNTKMMVIAHVFGSRCNLDAIAEECSKRGVLLVEVRGAMEGGKERRLILGLCKPPPPPLPPLCMPSLVP